MALLSEEIKKEVQIELQGLKNEVKLIVFTQEIECEYCNENRLLAEEIASLSDKIKVEVYKIDKIPAIAVCDVTGKDYGIRFYGVPAGYEFTSLMEAEDGILR